MTELFQLLTQYIRDLELYGGDIKSDCGQKYIDWDKLNLGASKNASFYVRSNRNYLRFRRVDDKLAFYPLKAN
jgi:hypothetical protein